MTNFNNIQNKLEAFIRRYYTNELFKGAILFFAIGLLYFLLTLFIEHILWLNTAARTVMFWLFIAVEMGLLIKFICMPLAKLFKLKNGINYQDASKIIGSHFPAVNDKLLNILQLQESNSKSELILASIEQKSIELKPVPFKLAINFKGNIRYLKYAAIPVFIIFICLLTGNASVFSDSYKRVVDYSTAYEAPAPFQFFVVNENLSTIENKEFNLVVKTLGDVMPKDVEITYNNETYVLRQTNIGTFEYMFSDTVEPIEFQLSANGVRSKPYILDVVEIPVLTGFEMFLNYPKHTNKQPNILKGTGNALVPEGTVIKWKLKTQSTSSVSFIAKDTLLFKAQAKGSFELSKQVTGNLDYILSTSNSKLSNYENLGFNINVIKDEFPVINVQVKKDSVDLQSLYFFGKVSDDYAVSKLQLVYYPVKDEQNKKTVEIDVAKSNFAEFVSAFPNNLDVEVGVAYDLYFQVFDNDKVNRIKHAKSNVFSFRKRTQAEEEEKSLKEQSETIKDLDKSLVEFSQQDKSLQELTKMQKEKSNLNFNDKKKLENFLKRQKEQDKMMKEFNKKLKDNLQEFQNENDKKDEFKDDLQKRLKDNEEKLKKDEALLKEIEKIQDKINKEELIKKLDELSKQNKNKKKSLEQLLELTKRFYVEKKLERLKDDLSKLAEEQEKLANKEPKDNTKKEQDLLNEKFKDFKKALNDLENESKALKKPIDIPRDKLEEKEVDTEQTKASEALEKNEPKNDSGNKGEVSEEKKQQNAKSAKKSQKSAGKKMKQMSAKMQGAMSGGGSEKMQEDADMLRQILDNLVLFSFDQEDLMKQFKKLDGNSNTFANNLKKQNSLREHFEHVDDSLFALSMRQPKLSEEVNTEITEVYYNIDKALERLADNQVFQGLSNQQYAVTAANNLANFLSNALDNMEQSMSMSAGKGGEGDMQLPDMIMSQEELNKMMEEGLKKGESGKPKEGQGKQPGKGEDGGDKKGGEKGGKEGDKGKGNKNGEGKGSDEGQEYLLFEIYKQQQQLRQALQDKLLKEGINPNGNRLLKRMENVEMDLLNNGITRQTLQKMMELKHQLLKLENATLKQGEDNKRESNTNKKLYSNSTNSELPKAKQYFQTTEILNRQALPLQQIYKNKVQEYFKEMND